MGRRALRASSHVDPGVPRGSSPRQAASSYQERSRADKADAQTRRPGSVWSSWLAGRGRGAFHLCLAQRLKKGCLAGGRCAQVSSRETMIGGPLGEHRAVGTSQ